MIHFQFFILDPKLKDVTFEYLINGKKIPSDQLTTTDINQAFGSSEYLVTGSYLENKEINEIEIIVKSQNKVKDTISLKPCFTSPKPLSNLRCIPNLSSQRTTQDPTENFMERLWAFKRINYLLNEKKDCTKGVSNTFGRAVSRNKNDICKTEALNLALNYNFVTDLTSIVIEENDDYITKGPVEVNKNLKQIKQTRKTLPSSGVRNVNFEFSPGILNGPFTIAQSSGGNPSSIYVPSTGSLRVNQVSFTFQCIMYQMMVWNNIFV